jgi:DNA-binding XRE family transcriptional regulator
MSFTLGLSKKTLVDIEKERRSLGWTGSMALCLIFQESEVIAGVFGGQPTDVIMALAFENRKTYYPRALGSRIWWIKLYENMHFHIQQNVISQHYRLLTIDGRRVASSFDLDDLMPLFNGIKR